MEKIVSLGDPFIQQIYREETAVFDATVEFDGSCLHYRQK